MTNPIENAIQNLMNNRRREDMIAVLEAINLMKNQEEQFIVPVELPQAAFDMVDVDKIKVGDVIQAKEDLHLKMRKITDDKEKNWLVAFTSKDEVEKAPSSSTITVDITSMLQQGLNGSDIEGIALNPWGMTFFLDKDMIEAILNAKKTENHIFLEQGDITKMDCDCIVNAANNSLLGGGGVDGAIHRAAGPELLAECRTLHGCETGKAKITKGYNLKASYIIHTVGPIYSGKDEDEELLRSCYWNSLELAKEYNLHSIAFPAISTGAYGYPLKKAIPIAMLTASKWLDANKDYGMAIVFSCFDKNTYDLYQSFIDYCHSEQ